MSQAEVVSETVRCPVCGSEKIVPVRKNYDGGLGCLGLVLFGWMGLLLGLLGGNEIEMYCQKCGCRWNPQGGGGCLNGCFSVAAVIVAVSAMVFLALLILAGFAAAV